MKTLFIILLLFVCSSSFGQTIRVGDREFNRVLSTYVKKQATLKDMYPAVVSDWMFETLLKEINTLKTQVAALGGGTSIDSIVALRKEIEKLKMDTVYVFLTNGVVKSGTGASDKPLEVALTEDSTGADIPQYTTAERDALPPDHPHNRKGTLIYNLSTNKINLRTHLKWSAVSSSN